MKDTATLGEVKARCAEMSGKYGDNCCEHCEFAEIGCCDAPEYWQLDDLKPTSQPNWEELYRKAEDLAVKMQRKAEESYARAEHAEAENRKLRTIVSTVETMLGRKFDYDKL